jgi:hypothetical protein
VPPLSFITTSPIANFAMHESCSLIVERDSTLCKVWVDFMNESQQSLFHP